MSIDKHRNPNGTYDGIGVMSEVTGLPRDEIRALAEQVKANHAKLRACPWHEFEQLPPDPDAPAYAERSRYRCRNCQGEVDHHAYHWHEQGRRRLPGGTMPGGLGHGPGVACLACGDQHPLGVQCPSLRPQASAKP